MKRYRHQNREDCAEVTPIEEDANWIIGVVDGDKWIHAHHLQINVYCKVCMWYVGIGPAASHSLECPIRTKMNQTFLRKVIMCAKRENL
jgi:hypothetical protein